MKLLVDVDALAKLAHWKILEELPDFTGVPLSQCATLTSARFRAQRAVKKPDGRVFHSTEAATVALRAMDSMTGPLSPETEHLPILQGVAGIDAGEAVLLSAVSAHSARLLTGDKRAMKALAGLDSTQRAPFAGKIVLIEQVLLAGLTRRGIEWLRERVCPYKQIDKAIGNAMGSRCDAPQDSVREGLESYIKELEHAVTPTLISKI
jgi:hypothetical protein